MSLICTLLLATGLPPGLAVEYEFVPKLSQVWILTHGPTETFGRLDRHGDFTPMPGWVNIDPSRIISIPFHCGALNPPWKGRHEKVYEFRSGHLIPGELDEDGNFVPDLAGKIIVFKDYKYVPEKSRRIYNLPGRFVAKLKAGSR